MTLPHRAAVTIAAIGTKRRFAARQQFGRFQGIADIGRPQVLDRSAANDPKHARAGLSDWPNGGKLSRSASCILGMSHGRNLSAKTC
jgi:hypothetical protein